jgi:hypothetical protein
MACHSIQVIQQFIYSRIYVSTQNNTAKPLVSRMYAYLYAEYIDVNHLDFRLSPDLGHDKLLKCSPAKLKFFLS